ncbi:hypothetical protein PRK78_006444 [Emydomyces testavorans]|uniref:Uncharacterized protein n=1 Tax=Emydomyces testavorans TaxID=2070801 RepID=A0AAF0ILP1_9EURO|nr:hypothetical protein PRK78_006444 [Emydomyces testavorans]
MDHSTSFPKPYPAATNATSEQPSNHTKLNHCSSQVTDHASSSEHSHSSSTGTDNKAVSLGSLGTCHDTPIDALPSLGHGTPEVLEITKILENAGICCCLVGISALKYYGAWRVRHDWEICVPTDMLEKASQIFKSEPHCQTYETCAPNIPQISSLLHTFPRFKIKGVYLYFVILPAEDAHLNCVPSNIERSQTGLPYPKLSVFAQSLLETYDEVALTDLVDGMNLTEEWGSENLDLAGTTDGSYALLKNEKIRASVPPTEDTYLLELPRRPGSKRTIWERIVSTKERRMGIELPKEHYATRFYARCFGDPRLQKRDFV